MKTILILLLLCSPASAANYSWSTVCTPHTAGSGSHCQTVIVVRQPSTRRIHYPNPTTRRSPVNYQRGPGNVTYGSGVVSQGYVEAITIQNPYFK